jgi:hypothetical protein
MKKTLIILFSFLVANANAQLITDFEFGTVFTGYNNIRIPGDLGTRIDVTDHLDQNFSTFLRGRITFTSPETGKHSFSILAAPLTIEYEGETPYNIRFQDTDFFKGEALKITYRFDSYRLTYRYNFLRMEKLKMGAGLTLKVRDASIRFVSVDKNDVKSNLGVVPLINFAFRYLPSKSTAITLDGDALAAPMGRAADIALFFNKEVYKHLWLKGGYRFLEGGSDGNSVYNFSFIHYAAFGGLILF